MKTNAIIRIIIWSLVLVLLVGTLSAGLLYRNGRFTGETAAATEVLIPEIDAGDTSLKPWEERTDSCDVEAAVTADALNVRSAPTSDSSAVGMLKKGDIVSINQGIGIGSQSEMWLSIYAPVEGWIKAEYVDSLEGVEFYGSEALRAWPDSSREGTSATASAIVTIYSAPDTTASALGQVEPGDPVVIGRQEQVNGETWAYITEPSAGWVMVKNLTVKTVSTSDAPAGDSFRADPRQIREIDIEWAAGRIILEPADVDSIQFSEAAASETKHAMVWKQNNDKLSIRFSENLSWDLGIGISLNDVVSKDLIILVPAGWVCDSLEIDAASATVDVKNMTIREVDFDGASGTCNFANCHVEKLDLDTASGDVYFTGSLDVMDCDAASASIYGIFSNVPSRIDMDSMSGDLDITLPSTAGFTVSMDALASDFVCEFGYSQQKDNTYRRGDGSCRISLDALSGDLYIREAKDTDALPESP